jgi:predicted lipid-binding transport protein (Tim44 family)
MKSAYLLIPLAAVAFTGAASAQAKIFRCGNTYTNDEAQAKAQNCKLVEGGNVTVVQGTRVMAAPQDRSNAGTKVVAAPPASGQRIDSSEQKARDGEARGILEAELRKAESRLADLQKEYNAGEPEKLGPETRNHQKYLDRVSELKANIERTEKDIAGLKRELGRAGNATPTANK